MFQLITVKINFPFAPLPIVEMSIKDAKSKQLLEKVAHAFNIEQLAMESLAAEQQLGPVLQNFLSINGAPCILFTYDAQASEPLGVYTELADMPQDTT